jgi:hypothetical protein
MKSTICINISFDIFAFRHFGLRQKNVDPILVETFAGANPTNATLKAMYIQSKGSVHFAVKKYFSSFLSA